MLGYEWGNPPSTIVLAGNDEAAVTTGADPDQTHRQIFDHYTSHSLLSEQLLHHHHHQPGPSQHSAADFSHYQLNPQPHHHHHHHHHHNIQHPFFDPRAFPGASPSSFPPPEPHPPPSMLSLDSLPAVNAGSPCGPGGFLVVPKSEDVVRSTDFPASRIGLNLGGRTYFSSDDDFVSRLYRRSRPAEPGSMMMAASNSHRCQAEGCNADLSHAKHYHRRHKVCEFHSKAATVVAAGLTQRFCQQCSRLWVVELTELPSRTCALESQSLVSPPYKGQIPRAFTSGEKISSRFHLLSEFDNGKRSCRKRLADHNRRRRKTQHPNQEILKTQIDNSRNSTFDSVTRSPPDSGGAQAMSSVTVAVSPPDYFRQTAYQNQRASPSAASNSMFFSSG